MARFAIVQPFEGETGVHLNTLRASVAKKYAGRGWQFVETLDTPFTGSIMCGMKDLAKILTRLSGAEIAIFVNGWQNDKGCRCIWHACQAYRITCVEEDGSPAVLWMMCQ